MTLQAGTPLAPLTPQQIQILRDDLAVLSAEQTDDRYLQLLNSSELGRSVLAAANAAAVRALIAAVSQADGDARYLQTANTTAFGRSIANAADVSAAQALLAVLTQAAADSRYLQQANTTALGRSLANAASIDAALNALTKAVPREIAGATTLGPTDLNCTLDYNAAGPSVITIPNNATLQAVPGISVISIRVQGAGRPTFAGDGATILGTVPTTGLVITLLCTMDANTWVIA